MDYLRGYRVFRDDPEWGKKLLVGSVFFLSTMCIPIIGQVVLIGWQGLILRRAVRGQYAPMPRLDFDFDWIGKLLGLGFKAFIARFLWSLPVSIIAVALVMCIYIGGIAAAAGAASADPDAVPLALCCMGAGVIILVPVMMLLAIPATVAGMRAELTGDLNAGLDFRAVLHFTREMFRELAIGHMVLGVVSMFVVLAGELLLCVGVFPATVLTFIVQPYFVAQVYEKWLERGGEPLPLASADDPTAAIRVPPSRPGASGGNGAGLPPGGSSSGGFPAPPGAS